MEKEHFEILLEEMNSKFNLVLEGHAALDKKLDAKFDELNEKIEQNTFMIGVVNDSLSKRIDELDERLGNRIDELDERLSNRIDELDERLSTKLDAVAADLSEHRTDTEAHHGMYRVKEDGPEYK
jgi:cytochrome c556